MRNSVTHIALRKAPLLAMFAFTFLVNAVCFGQAMDDPNFQVLDYEILEASVGTNDVLPAGP